MVSNALVQSRRYLRVVGALALTSLVWGCSASIHDTVARQDTTSVVAVLEKSPDAVHALDHKQKTPLHIAVTYRKLEVMPLLLARGADINSTDITGMTPLHVAAMLGRREEATWLLEHGADPLIEDDYGDTPLHTAALFGHGQIAGLLVERGVAPDRPNGNGETPLAIAKRYRQDRIARYLEHLMERS